MLKYLFKEPLTEGIIIKRSNRFIMDVLIGGEIVKCHCPSTGKIGDIIFNNNPCLLSKCDGNNKRKTKYSVEAISLNNINDKEKYYMGINQVRTNRYIEYFLKTNQLKKMIDCEDVEILREKVLGNSKLDFCVKNSYIEVKTPLIKLQVKDYYKTNENIKYYENSKFNSADRFIKHVMELSNSLKTHEKAYLITFFMSDAEEFKPPINSENKLTSKIIKLVAEAEKSGVEMWQVNATIDKYGVELKDYFRMRLFG